MSIPNEVTVSLLQIGINSGDPDHNFRSVQDKLVEAVNGKTRPDLLVLPEMWNTGYAMDKLSQLADVRGERTTGLFREFCRENQVSAVAGSVAEHWEGQVRNTAYTFGNDGSLTSHYTKIHLFGPMGEDQVLTAGTRPGRVDIGGIPAGVAICYDIRFPELIRSLALSGAQMLIVPAHWPKARIGHWRALLIARAIENQMYVLGCNRSGTSDGTEYAGHSLIIDPLGELIAEAGEGEEILTATLSPGLVKEVRSRIPVFRDRRPDCYV